MACTATRDGAPCGAALHGDKDARDHENERDAKFSHLLGNRDRRNCAAVAGPSPNSAIARCSAARQHSMDLLQWPVADDPQLLTDALRQRRIKTQRRRERLRIPEITPASGAAARPQEGLPWHLKTAARRPGAGKSLLAASGQRIDPPPPLLRVQFIIVGRAGMSTLLHVRA